MIEALFLDRDGVINRERADYVKSWQEFELLPSGLEALAHLGRLEQPIFVVTNQSAIGRGLMTHAILDDIHARLQRLVKANGGHIDSFYVCPHRPDERCECRKPKAGLLFQAAREHHLSLPNCLFVGDSITDYQAARTAGCQSILVETGRQGSQLPLLLANEQSKPTVVPDLASAVSLILSGNGPTN